MDIKNIWAIFKSSSMQDRDMQRAFERAATPNSCIELLEENERIQNELDSYKTSMKEIESRFKDKLNLHKEDCFCYQVAVRALKQNNQDQ